MKHTLCTKCHDNERRSESQRWCNNCHAEYMRENRPKHSELPEDSRKRANARSYANVYLNRGKIERGECSDCGYEGEEMHHEDYTKPLDITWLCKNCHTKRHAEEM